MSIAVILPYLLITSLNLMWKMIVTGNYRRFMKIWWKGAANNREKKYVATYFSMSLCINIYEKTHSTDSVENILWLIFLPSIVYSICYAEHIFISVILQGVINFHYETYAGKQVVTHKQKHNIQCNSSLLHESGKAVFTITSRHDSWIAVSKAIVKCME